MNGFLSWQWTCCSPRQMRWTVCLLIGLTFAAGRVASGQAQTSPEAGTMTFRSGIDLVTVSAVVRDHKGRIVSDLRRWDFEVLDNGERRPITEFRSERAAVSVALLFDGSGSMQVAARIDEARQAARHVLAWLEPGRDELAVYSFDTSLHELQPFGPYQPDAALERSFGKVAPFGMTSLFDAIAATARALATRPTVHRAVLVMTDGLDNASRLSPAEVSGIASSIDVPVYIVGVVSPLDHVGAPTAVSSERPVPVGDLADLARWTGGEFFVTSAPSQTSLAARQIVDDLRHQYLIAFEPAHRPGWHPLELRTRDRQLVVKARSGYMAGQSRTGYIEAPSR